LPEELSATGLMPAQHQPNLRQTPCPEVTVLISETKLAMNECPRRDSLVGGLVASIMLLG
jgi:hypothetical protein